MATPPNIAGTVSKKLTMTHGGYRPRQRISYFSKLQTLMIMPRPPEFRNTADWYYKWTANGSINVIVVTQGFFIISQGNSIGDRGDSGGENMQSYTYVEISQWPYLHTNLNFFINIKFFHRSKPTAFKLPRETRSSVNLVTLHCASWWSLRTFHLTPCQAVGHGKQNPNCHLEKPNQLPSLGWKCFEWVGRILSCWLCVCTIWPAEEHQSVIRPGRSK